MSNERNTKFLGFAKLLIEGMNDLKNVYIEDDVPDLTEWPTTE